MKAKAALLVLIVLLIIFWPVHAAVPSPQFTMQTPAPRALDVAGGRPGVFHFQTHAQRLADEAEIADLRAGLERVRAAMSSVPDAGARRDIQGQLERWQLHLARLEESRKTSASPTAGTVEARLNDMKGHRMCGVCHGGMAQPGTLGD